MYKYRYVYIIQRTFLYGGKLICDYNKKNKLLYFFYVSIRVEINASKMLIDSD